MNKSLKKVKRFIRNNKPIVLIVSFFVLILLLIFIRYQMQTECGEDVHTGDCCTFRGFGFNYRSGDFQSAKSRSADFQSVNMVHITKNETTESRIRRLEIATTMGGDVEIAPTYTTNTNNRSSI